jgi:hypothetical protein
MNLPCFPPWFSLAAAQAFGSGWWKPVWKKMRGLAAH